MQISKQKLKLKEIYLNQTLLTKVVSVFPNWLKIASTRGMPKIAYTILSACPPGVRGAILP